MRKFLHHMRSTREPHQRRTHALMVASVITGFVALVWLVTLPLRLQGPALPVASDDSGNQTTLTAAVQNAPTDSTGTPQDDTGAAQLEVSTTSVFQ